MSLVLQQVKKVISDYYLFFITYLILDFFPCCLLQNYISWVDKDTFNQVTKPRYGSLHPWPLNWVLTRAKRQRVYKRLGALGWLDKTIEQVNLFSPIT